MGIDERAFLPGRHSLSVLLFQEERDEYASRPVLHVSSALRPFPVHHIFNDRRIERTSLQCELLCEHRRWLPRNRSPQDGWNRWPPRLAVALPHRRSTHIRRRFHHVLQHALVPNEHSDVVQTKRLVHGERRDNHDEPNSSRRPW